ncbi:DUF4382 domain-containing protein [Halomonas denitrificans]|nr:DUF4382 domain-containing protein [Halomonas denitrificans]
MKQMKTLVAASLVGLLSACGGGDDNNSVNTGTFNLGVSDAPVEEASEVVLFFSHVVMVPEDGGDAIVFDFAEDEGAPRSVDLLDFQGSNADFIISERELPVGDYRMCMYALNGDGSEELSYVNSKEQGIVPLSIDSQGSCYGTKPDIEDGGRLKLTDERLVSINVGINSFVAEFDLRKGLVDPKNAPGMKIKPNAVRLVSVSEIGTISGTLAQTQFDACEADFSSLLGASEFSHAAYLYAGSRDRTTMGDIAGDQGFPTDSALVEPVAVASINPVDVVQDDGTTATELQYEFGFIGEGTYSIGYTCVANADQPDTHETDEEGFAIYQHYTPVEVKANEETVQDLDPIL